jgi:predicted nucleic acid-binding protein
LILYCDTSALVKLYVQEAFSDEVLVLARSASLVAVSRIAWAEAFAAFARRAREAPADHLLLETARERFRADWSDNYVMEVSQSLVELAADLADTFALRAYDSVQLASAEQLKRSASETLAFACFDNRLRKAAQILGMDTLPNGGFQGK